MYNLNPEHPEARTTTLYLYHLDFSSAADIQNDLVPHLRLDIAVSRRDRRVPKRQTRMNLH